MTLFVNTCFLVLLNFAIMFLVEEYYGFEIQLASAGNRSNIISLAKYSFVVLVNSTTTQTLCTGALISRTFVLTAAHCVSEETDTSARVFRGNLDDVQIENVLNITTTVTDQVKNRGYEERRSVAIIQPWLYKKPASAFDIALVQVDKKFKDLNFIKARPTRLLPLSQYNIPIKCDVVGYDVDAIFHPHSRKKNLLTEYTILVKKLCKKKQETDETCSAISWIVQQDEQYIDRAFAKSAALLLCSDNLSGIAEAIIDVTSPGTPNKTQHGLTFLDICPYLSWIRSYVGPSVIRSPGINGKGCVYSSASIIRTQAKSIIDWFLVLVCMYVVILFKLVI